MQTSKYNTAFSQEQVDVFKAFEKRLRPWMDKFYKGLGYEVLSRYTKDGEVGRDLFLGRDGRKIKIEEKFRTHVWNDFLIEILQDVLPPMSGYKLGWFYHCKSEQVINVFCESIDAEDPKKIYAVDMSKLKQQFPILISPKVAMKEAERTGSGLTKRDVTWLRNNMRGYDSSPSKHKFVVSAKGKGLSLSVCIPWEILLTKGIAKELL